MSSNYPGGTDIFVNPAGTNFLAGTPAGASAVDHASTHTNLNDSIEAIESATGTHSGTNALMHFVAGQFPVRHTGVAATGTLVQTLVGGTFTSSVLNANTIGSPIVTSGTTTSALFNSGTLGTPSVLGSLQLRDVGIITQIGTADNID